MIKFAYEHFSLLPEISIDVFANRLSLICRAIMDFDELSAEALDNLATLESFLLRRCTNDIINYERSEFRGCLESHPFSTALLLIQEGKSTEVKARLELHCAILARVFVERGHDDYDAYLRFYRAILTASTPLPFGVSFVTLASAEELQLELRKVATLRKSQALINFSNFIQPRRQRVFSDKPHPFFTAPNRHRKSLSLNEETYTDLLTATNSDGDEVDSFLKITPKLDTLRSQEFAAFAKKISGIERALYGAELRPAWSNLAATPSEVTLFLNTVTTHLLNGNYQKISNDAAPLFLLFLKLLGIREPGKLKLVNRGSPRYKNSESGAGEIHYELKKSQNAELKDARLTLNARLLEVKGPSESSARIHFFAQDLMTLRLAEPFFSLLQNLVTTTQPSKRLNHTIENAFEISEDEYRTWFAQKLKKSGLRQLNITKSSIESAFHNFARQSVPEVTLNLLSGQSTVQQHYVSQKRETIVGQIDGAWRQFMGLIGLKRKTSMQLPSYPKDHDEAGSMLTIRPEILRLLYSSILDNVTAAKVVDSTAERIFAFNFLASYIYLRIATTVGLRPVKKPLPTTQHYSSSLKMMSLADKRAHHRKERRLIVLTTRLCELLDAHISVSAALAVSRGLPQAPAILCALEDEKWQHFAQSYVEQLLRSLTGMNLDAHSLRHVSANRFLDHQYTMKSVCQADVNQLLNHARASVYPLSLWSSESVTTMTARLRTQMEAYDCEFDALDAKALAALSALEKGLSR